MNMETDKELLEDFARTRNIKNTTKRIYQASIELYAKYNEKTMVELIQEAETEEEKGIRWKHRKIKKRLIEFRIFLTENYLKSYVKSTLGRIISIYKHYEIEIHNLPLQSNKNLTEPVPITFKDLPDKKIIKQSLKIANPLMRAIILFMSSSGCARGETLNITIQDFINATSDYHNSNNIYEVINILKNRDDIIPTFKIRRVKTNKYYHTFCSPEAVTEIINYLLTINKNIKNNDFLFTVHPVTLINYFNEINNKLHLGKKGTYIRFRSHMLRKFHASALQNNGMNKEDINCMQGKSQNATDESYFFEDPNKLREKYIQHMDCLTINLDVNNLNIKSPEYTKLETENHTLKSELNKMDEIMARLTKLEQQN